MNERKIKLNMNLLYAGKATLIAQLLTSSNSYKSFDSYGSFVWSDPYKKLKSFKVSVESDEFALYDDYISLPEEFYSSKDKNGIKEVVRSFYHPEDRGEYVERLFLALKAYCRSRIFTFYDELKPTEAQAYIGKEVVPILQNENHHPENYFLEGVMMDGRFVLGYKPTTETIFPKYEIFKRISLPINTKGYEFETKGVLDDKVPEQIQKLTITIKE